MSGARTSREQQKFDAKISEIAPNSPTLNENP
jgi:hypothetical protein